MDLRVHVGLANIDTSVSKRDTLSHQGHGQGICHRYLTGTLSSPNAIWTLTSIMLPKTPEADFKRDAKNPLLEAILNYEIIHIEAYVVYIDMVLRKEVAYKLTKDTIDALAKHHRKGYCVNVANACDWPDREQWCKKLHEYFVQEINEFVFRTHVSALEGLEEDSLSSAVVSSSKCMRQTCLKVNFSKCYLQQLKHDLTA
ncbi:hypothetical protein CDV36_016564 [Fusarium kuroshium]|uniref:Uncharacterized protein n=1 Tax=Fusarium kuroshium TaxID=2010991 RepID=A0A3M2QLB2_9HYPO|nr:hypothetical protein CDV36_016564 [Fusarium kuroshium]